MKKVFFKKMALLGVGLIGGSLAIDCRKKGLVGTVAGYGRKEANLRKAVSLGVIESYDLNLEKVVADADLVVLATPLGSYREMVKKMLPFLSPETIVTDVGSVKGKVIEELESILGSFKFVPGHPVAGREKSSVEAAIPDLFKGARCILTPTASTDPLALKKIKELWEETGAVVSILNSKEHDEILGMVSHLPHLVAYALVNTVLEASKGEPKLVSYSGGGFRDFTRIGASSPEMWKDIFIANREIVLDQIAKFEAVLGRLKKDIQENNGSGLLNEFEKSKKLKESLN
ncbi:MAG: prephenate dehydrogenase/arogenate dehydrogenase family protein [Nitrospirae bacterium]|nr:prephenate dehydrogenase/arogenate dehydrogenase family protein [Nitrospirota bacterium]MBI3593409.1 prephenate dehydrogenase/arogenate dehydrogenase family protein [Nitrospirota bacterium]